MGVRWKLQISQQISNKNIDIWIYVHIIELNIWINAHIIKWQLIVPNNFITIIVADTLDWCRKGGAYGR